MKKLYFIYVVVFLLLVSNAAAQAPDTLWTKTYGGAGDDKGTSVQQTNDKGYIIAGNTESFGTGVYLVKTDENGDTLWTHTYVNMNGGMAPSCRQTFDNGYIIAGNGNGHCILVKTDENGDTLWTRSYGGQTEGNTPVSVQQTNDTGYVFTSFTFVGMTIFAYLVKTDADGDSLWSQTYGDPYSWNIGNSVQQTSDGGYIITGTTISLGIGDVFLIKTNANGDTLWTRTYGGTHDDRGYSVQQTTDGGYIVAGHTRSFGAGDWDIYLIKSDDNGDTLWTRTYGGAGDEYGGYCVQQTNGGGYIIAGGTNSYGAGADDVYLIKTDGNGDTLWTKTCGGGAPDVGWSVQQTSDNGYIVAGHTQSFGAGNWDFYLIRLDVDSVSVDEISLVNQSSKITSVYPNPFNPSTTISFSTTENMENAELTIYDITGQKVKTLVNATLPAGNHSITWHGRDANNKSVASGIYFCIMKSGKYTFTKKMILMK